MNTRLQELREALDLTQRKFGERLGVRDTAISKLEKGANKLTDQMIRAICNEFNVNEEWLRTGEGGEDAMFNDTDESIIESLSKADNLTATILRSYIKLSDTRRNEVNQFIKALAMDVLDGGITKAKTGVLDLIANSAATDKVKTDLHGKVAVLFHESFPYDADIGSYNPSEELTPEAFYVEKDEAQLALHKKLDEQIIKEKKLESQVSSAKESDVV